MTDDHSSGAPDLPIVDQHPQKIQADAVAIDPTLTGDEGWVDMSVQFLATRETIGTEHAVLGYTTMPPGARHEPHRHPNAEEIVFLTHGEGLYLVGDVLVRWDPGTSQRPGSARPTASGTPRPPRRPGWSGPTAARRAWPRPATRSRTSTLATRASRQKGSTTVRPMSAARARMPRTALKAALDASFERRRWKMAAAIIRHDEASGSERGQPRRDAGDPGHDQGDATKDLEPADRTQVGRRHDFDPGLARVGDGTAGTPGVHRACRDEREAEHDLEDQEGGIHDEDPLVSLTGSYIITHEIFGNSTLI